jgi:TonB-linked SusC/RagA family outer membrane protein
MKKAVLIIISLFLFSTGFAQITGKVFDENGKTIPGSTILVKGTTIGTTTNLDGQYSIDAKTGDVLVFSFLGYEKQEAMVKAEKVINIYLKPKVIDMKEVVVMGYSSKTKTEISSSVAVVKAAKLKGQTTTDLGKMIQGKVAGVQVVNSSGAPGAEAQIRIRGVSTMKPGNQQPLVVVDGIIGGTYDPNDIASVTILKGAGATGLYGARANKGVIIITTKTAQQSKTHFEFKASIGGRAADQGNLRMMNGSEFYNTTKELYRNPNTHQIDVIKFYKDFPKELSTRNYNWVDDVFKPALIQNYYLSANGREGGFSYYVSGTYYDAGGTFLKTNYKKGNLRVNTKYQFSKKVSVSNNINISNSYGSSYDYMNMYYSYLNLPWDNPYDSTGAPRYVDAKTQGWWSRDHINPIHTIENSDHNYNGVGINYDLVFNWKITKWLSFNSANRLSYSNSKSHDFVSPIAAGTYHGKGYISERQDNWKGFITTNLLKFNFSIKKHSIDGLAGVEGDNGYSNYISVQGKGLPVGFSVPSVASSELAIGGSNSKELFRSFISQVNYNYDKKYFVTASFRADATSNFPAENRTAYFPSVAASWLVTNMNFMKHVSVVNLLKLRLSYGITGDPDIGASRYMGLFSLTTQYNNYPAATPSQLQNYHLTWESTNEMNVGIDLGLFNRLSLTVDAYNNITNNLLVLASQPLSQGFQYRWENIGTVTNKGIDVSIQGQIIKKKDFSWLMSVAFGSNKNILSGLNKPIVKTVNGISQIYRNGGELYTFLLPKWLGVDPQTGGPLWEKVTKDAEGNVVKREPTGNYSEATPQEVGHALPDFQGGFSTSFRYKNLELVANFSYTYGNDVYNFIQQFMNSDGHEPYYNYMVPAPDWSRWAKPGDIATEPSMQNNNLSTQNSSRYLEKGNFLKLNSVTLTYRFPQKIVKGMGLRGLILSLDANNVWTWTKYWGQNPEATLTNSDWSMPGVNDFRYPNNKQAVLNVQIQF